MRKEIPFAFLCLFVFFAAIPSLICFVRRMVLGGNSHRKRICSRRAAQIADNATTFPFHPLGSASTMSLSALLPAAIPGLAVLSAGVARVAASGLSFASMLVDPAGAPAAAAPAPSKPQLPAGLQKAVSEFAAILKEKLAAMGASLSGSVELSADVLGGVEAQGNEQDVRAVEQLLAQDQDLSAAFLQLAGAFNQAMGQTNAVGLSMPWDVAGAAQGTKLVVGESGATMATKN